MKDCQHLHIGSQLYCDVCSPAAPPREPQAGSEPEVLKSSGGRCGKCFKLGHKSDDCPSAGSDTPWSVEANTRTRANILDSTRRRVLYDVEITDAERIVAAVNAEAKVNALMSVLTDAQAKRVLQAMKLELAGIDDFESRLREVEQERDEARQLAEECYSAAVDHENDINDKSVAIMRSWPRPSLGKA